MLFSRRWLGEYVELPPGDFAPVAEKLTAVGLAVETVEEQGDDLVFDVDVTTNRPDCMNHLGLARELAVALGRPLAPPPASTDGGEAAAGGDTAAGACRVTIEDPEGCYRYVARVVRGVAVGPSPEWLRRRLEAIGLRPINNVVDVTNYVLWESGQPLHAFDLATLAGDPVPEIRVRRARAGERLTTLDGEERELAADALVIADAERPVALAGVMGGLDTEVTADTRNLLIESAHFDPRAVRAAAKGLGLHTDASHRFERGADPEACRAAADRAAELIAELAGGEVVAGAVDVRAPVPPAGRTWPPRGRLTLADLAAFAGVEIAAADVERWLSGLGFALEPANGAGADDGGGDGRAWEVTVPSWRWYDLEPGPSGAVYPADLYEEVLRHHGFDAIPSALPTVAGTDGPPTAAQRRRDRVRDRLAAAGYAEAINFAFQSRAADASAPVALGPEGTGERPPLALSNPLSERYEVLRRSLVPNLVENARFNLRRGASAVRLFEVGRLFFDLAGAPATAPGEAAGAARSGPLGPSAEGSEGLPVEEVEAVALIAGGTVGTPWSRAVELDLFDLKGVVEALAAELGVALAARPAELAGVVPGTGAHLEAAPGARGAARVAGWFGRLDSADPDEPALYAAELALAALDAGLAEEAAAPVEPPPRFPGVAADLTLTHGLDVPWAEIAAAVEARRPADLAEFGLKDRYRGAGVPEGAVNTTLWFLYSSAERSLTHDEVNERQHEIASALAERFGWQRQEEGG